LSDEQKQAIDELIEACFPEMDEYYDYFSSTPWVDEMGAADDDADDAAADDDDADDADDDDADDDATDNDSEYTNSAPTSTSDMYYGVDSMMDSMFDDNYNGMGDGYIPSSATAPPPRRTKDASTAPPPRQLPSPPETYANRFCPGQTGDSNAHQLTVLHVVETTVALTGYHSRAGFTPLAREAFSQAVAESCAGGVPASDVHITNIQPAPKLEVTFAVSTPEKSVAAEVMLSLVEIAGGGGAAPAEGTYSGAGTNERNAERNAEDANEQFVALFGSLILRKGGAAPAGLAITVTKLPTKRTVVADGYAGSGKSAAAVTQSLDGASDDGANAKTNGYLLAFGGVFVAFGIGALVLYAQGRRSRAKFAGQLSNGGVRSGSVWSGGGGGGARRDGGFDSVVAQSPRADSFGDGDDADRHTYTVSVEVDGVEEEWDAIGTSHPTPMKKKDQPASALQECKEEC
jgi:hypothetical protein